MVALVRQHRAGKLDLFAPAKKPGPPPGSAPAKDRARSVLTFFAQDTGTHNLVYANADISKASQSREAITFCDHWKQVSGSDPKMLIMDQKVTTQEILGELDERGVRFATLRMRSRSLVKYINSLVPADFTTITLDRPGPHNRPKVHEDPAAKLTSCPGTIRQLVVTRLGREESTQNDLIGRLLDVLPASAGVQMAGCLSTHATRVQCHRGGGKGTFVPS